MARTKKSRRKTTGRGEVYVPPPPQSDRSTLLQLMGFPVRGRASPRTVRADWAAVQKRLESHPREARITSGENKIADYDYVETTATTMTDERTCNPRFSLPTYPLFLALTNEVTPVTLSAMESLMQAYPDLVTNPRSAAIFVAHYQNEKSSTRRDEIIEAIARYNPQHACRQPERTGVFQIMGFPKKLTEYPQLHHVNMPVGQSRAINWEALMRRLETHPHEASIVCPTAVSNYASFLYPLEAALRVEHSAVPLNVVRTLLRLCPEAVTRAKDSSALYLACCNRCTTHPDVVLEILRTNPGLAASTNLYYDTWGECGCPLSEAVHLPFAEQVLPELIAAYPAALSDTSNRIGLLPLQMAADMPKLSPAVLRVLLEKGHEYGVGMGDDTMTTTSNGGVGQIFIGDNVDRTPMASVQFRAALEMDRVDANPERQNDEDAVWAWQNFCLCLQAAGASKVAATTIGSTCNIWDYPLLHAAIEFAKRRTFLDRVFRENGANDVNRRDGLGRTALVVAIDMASNAPDDDDCGDVHFPTVIAQLLQNDSNNDNNNYDGSMLASVAAPNGRLPLHYAVSKGLGLPDGLGPILHANPGALSVTDPYTGLLPCFLAAAVGAQARVETIYACIAARPNLLVNTISRIRHMHTRTRTWSENA